MAISVGADSVGVLTLNPLVNGFSGTKKAAATTADSEPAVVDAGYIDNPNDGYLQGYTMEEIIHARTLSDPYLRRILPPFAHLVPLNLESFRTGHQPTPDELYSELPMTFDGQVPLAEIIDKVVQDSYINLSELAEVMPSFSDLERKTRIIQYAMSTRKQIIKLYAIAKWARVAEDVQKAMDVLTFLARSEHHVEIARHMIEGTAASMVMLKRRNADLLNAIDVLTMGTYRRLPSVLQETFKDYKPITDAEVITTLKELDDAVMFRLRFDEILPVSMNIFTVSDGRARFKAKNLFEAEFTLTGSASDDFWYMLDMRFDINVGGQDHLTLTEFPKDPTPNLKTQIVQAVNQQLSLNARPPPGIRHEEIPEPPPPQATDVADAPLVRAFNLLQMLSLSYQLEILHYQAERLLSLGWGDYLKIDFSNDRKNLAVSYWVRTPPPTQPQQKRGTPPPLLGGTLTFKIAVNTKARNREASSKRHVNNILAELQQQTTFGPAQELHRRPSDTPDDAIITAEWQPTQFALAVNVRREDVAMDIVVDSNNLGFPEILKRITLKHAHAILRTVQQQLLQSPTGRHIFSDPSDVEVVEDDQTGHELRIRLCGSQTIIIAIDHRTGKFVFRDFGDFATSGRSQKFEAISKSVNSDPNLLFGTIMSRKYLTIIETIEHQANYLGLQNTRSRPFADTELIKFGPNIRISMYMGLAPYPGYYLVMLAFEVGLKWALVNVRDGPGRSRNSKVIGDWGWLDVDKIGGGDRWAGITQADNLKDSTGFKEKIRSQRNSGVLSSDVGWQKSFAVRTEVLRELYAFCCARVSHTKVEQQFKSRGIPCRPFFPRTKRSTIRTGLDGSQELAPDHSQANGDPSALTQYSPTASSVPVIWIRARDIFQTGSVADVAYENVKVKVVDWWSERPVRVITSLMLKEAPPLSNIGAKRKATSSDLPIARPSENISYDPGTSIVSFVSFNVETCVTEFLEEWDRIHRIVSLVRELGKVKRRMGWHDVQILRFDLQTVELAYHPGCVMSVEWLPAAATDAPASLNGTYDMTFSNAIQEIGVDPYQSESNPHSDLAAFLSRSFQGEAERSMGAAVKHLLLTLRNTLPVLKKLYHIKKHSAGEVVVFLKSPVWFRLLYRSKFAFDFRVLTDGQVAISEVATSFLSVRSSVPKADKPRPFTPLPGLSYIAKEVAQECGGFLTKKAALPPVVHTSNGLICKGPRLEDAIAKLHTKILGRIVGLGSTVT